jgi:hypothetical protein
MDQIKVYRDYYFTTLRELPIQEQVHLFKYSITFLGSLKVSSLTSFFPYSLPLSLVKLMLQNVKLFWDGVSLCYPDPGFDPRFLSFFVFVFLSDFE